MNIPATPDLSERSFLYGGHCPAQGICQRLDNLRKGCDDGFGQPEVQICLASVVMLLDQVLERMPPASPGAP
jgi:hypothetical protein